MIVGGDINVRRPDGPYWRRKVNRRVHRSRRLRTAARFGVLLSVNFAFLTVVAYAVVGVVRGVRESPRFALETVRVDGARRTTPDAVRAALSSHFGENLLSLDLDVLAAEVARLPWVREVAVKRFLPGTIRVEIAEREPAMQAVVDGGVRVVDDSGAVIGTTGPGLFFDLPVITGADAGPEEARRPLRARGVAALRALLEVSPEWAAGLSEIDLSRADRISVVSRAEEPRLYLDADRPGRNLAPWLALRREIGERLGTLDYVDLRWEGRIVALPVPATPRQGR